MEDSNTAKSLKDQNTIEKENIYSIIYKICHQENKDFNKNKEKQ